MAFGKEPVRGSRDPRITALAPRAAARSARTEAARQIDRHRIGARLEFELQSMFKDSMLSLAKAVGSSWGDMLPRFDSQPGESYSGVLNVPGHGELRVTAQGSISSSAVEVVINGKTRQPEVLIHWHGLRNLGAQRAKAELAKLPAMVEQALARSASLPPAPL